MAKNIKGLNKNGYTIDFASNTLVMNKKFAAMAATYGTVEYGIHKGIHTDFPSITDRVESGREITKPSKNKRMTYVNMETYIGTYSNSKELLEAFKTVKSMSKLAASPYKFVLDWFEMQFPNYKETPIFKDGELKVEKLIALPNIEDYKVKNAS